MKILVVDDDRVLAEMLLKYLRGKGHDAAEASNAVSGLELCSSWGPDLVFADSTSPNAPGAISIGAFKAARRDAAVVIMSDQPCVEHAVRALKQGAHDYLSKPLESQLIDRILESLPKGREGGPFEGSFQGYGKGAGGDYLVLEGEGMREVYAAIAKSRLTGDTAVLISGETGTGKEHAAELFHLSSGRRSKPLVKVHCAAIPDSLFESEVFGYAQGAFTDAKKGKEGLVENAQGGILFLDEIGELSLPTQAKLLRLLEQKTTRRLGALGEMKWDVQFLAATNRDLLRDVEEGRFRKDLYYRLRGLEIRLPPLRSSPKDIETLAAHFFGLFCRRAGLGLPPLDRDFLDALKGYAWPGNIRELKNLMQSLVVHSRGDRLRVQDLPAEMRASAAAQGSAAAEPLLLKESKRQKVVLALRLAQGNYSKAARMLGITRQTVARLAGQATSGMGG